MNDEYTELSFEELVVKAIDVRVDSGPLLMEARRRDESLLQELAAVRGVTLTTAWQPVGAISLDDGKYQIAMCIRIKPTEEDMGEAGPTLESTRFVQAGGPMHDGGGSWRDAGRTGG